MNIHNRILFLAANPTDTTRLRLDEESRSIDLALRNSKHRDRFEIIQHWAVRASDLQALLLRYEPNIVHFSGHGSHLGEIFLEDDSGKVQVVSTSALSSLFSLFSDSIKCVVLNACYSEPQAKAIAKNIDYVVGVSKVISDKAAIKFASSFYQALGYGRDVETAFKLGRLEIDLHSLGQVDAPQLIAKPVSYETSTKINDSAKHNLTAPSTYHLQSGLEFILDQTGYPMIWIEAISAYIHWIPVTKMQFEDFLNSEQDDFDTALYGEMLQLNSKIALEDVQAENYWRIMLSGIKPSEAQRFANWCGSEYSLPTLQEWLASYQSLKKSYAISIDEMVDTIKGMPEEVACVLSQLDIAASKAWTIYEGKSRTLADQMLMRMGIMEWVQTMVQVNVWGGMGETPPGFYACLATLAHGQPSLPISPETNRLYYYGFRLIRR